MSFRFWAPALFAALAAAAPVHADAFQVTTLVESPNFTAPAGFEGTGTPLVDPNLVNPWGLSMSATSPLWVSNQVAGGAPAAGVPTATLYSGDVNGKAFAAVPLVVQFPVTAGRQGSPTGQVFNTTTSFSVTGVTAGANPTAVTTPATFIFAGRNGAIYGWAPNVLTAPGATPNTAIPINGITPTEATAPTYTGLALVRGSTNFLFAANNNGSIDRFDGAGNQATFTYNFSSGGKTLVPFNVQELSNGKLYATFDAPGAYGGGRGSGGAIAIIDPTTGAVLASFVSQPGGALNGPWGLAIAPQGFGSFGGDLLVGNFDPAAAGLNGVIDVFDPNTLAFLGMLDNPDGTPIQIPGLWGLQFGNGTAGSPTTLFAVGGGPGENEGVLVAIDPLPVPEPGTLGLFLVGGAGLWLLRRRGARPA
jgi:uncharacterized protein (TIGR03118 family)